MKESLVTLRVSSQINNDHEKQETHNSKMHTIANEIVHFHYYVET